VIQHASESNIDSELLCSDTSNPAESSYCYCHGPEEGTMIACDNTECPIEWFHVKCLKLKREVTVVLS